MNGNRDSEEFWLFRFEENARRPIYWFLNAQNLKKDSELVLDASEQAYNKCMDRSIPLEGIDLFALTVFPVSVLLAGLAIENLLKGVIISQEPDSVKSGKLDSWISSTHNLTQLCGRAKVNVDQSEQDLILVLTESVVWSGKYPVPKQFKSLMPRNLLDGNPVARPSLSDSQALALEGLFERLSNLLQDRDRAVRRVGKKLNK